MFDLIDHIEFLLAKHDCVVVPDLGGFVVQYRHSAFSTDKKTILPPRRSVSFNAELSHNDGLLATSVMSYTNMSYSQSVSHIKEQVEILKKSIKDSVEGFEFGDLGLFYHTPEGSFEFKPKDVGCKISPQLFGLDTLNFPPLVKLQENKDDGNSTVRKADTIYIPLSKGFFKRISAVVAVVIVIMLIATPIHKQQVPVDYAGLVSSELLDNVTGNGYEDNGTSLDISTDYVDEGNRENAIHGITNKENQDFNLQEVKCPRYYIIVATLPSHKAAEKQLDNLRKAGYTQDIKIHDTANKARLYLESFSDKEEAQMYLRKIQSETFFTDAWILSEHSKIK